MKKYFSQLGNAVLKAGIFFLCFSVLLVLVYRFVPVPWTPLMFIKHVQYSGDEDYKGIQHEWVKFDEIPNSLMLAVVCTEDQNYLKHYGFDLNAIQQAMEEAEEGGRSRGASTISQQTAKNVFLWPSSTWLRKGFEVWFTLLIETFWSKERIMEVYLNSIEFGKGIYGCNAASKNYFRKPAERLTMSESARLAVVLPNPVRYNAEKPSGYVLKRQAWTLNQMRLWGGKLNFETKEELPEKKSRKKK